MAFNNSFPTEGGGSIQCQGYIPAITQTLIKSIAMNSTKFSPFSDSKIKSIMFKPAVGSGIIGLLFSCGPATIFFGITRVVVNSIQRHSCFRNTHVFNKIRKVFSPSIAHRNAASTIILIKQMFFFVTAAFYILPNRIKSAFAETMRHITFMKMFGASACPFFMKAAARKAHARLKMVASHLFLDPTIAYTRTMSSYRKDCPSFKSLSHNNRIDFTAWHKFLLCCVDNILLKIRSVKHGL